MFGTRLFQRPGREDAAQAPVGTPEKAVAIYLFYRTGEPLVALASERRLPIEADQLEGLLSIVGHFVEAETGVFPGYATTAMVYDDLGILAVRGRHTIAAAVYERPADPGLGEDLVRTVRSFESHRPRAWESLESAARTAERIADQLSRFLPHAPPPEERPRHALHVPGAHAR